MNDKLKFIVDLCVGKKVEDYLKSKYDVICVRDVDPKMPDMDIIKLAEKEKRLIITMDKDFGELVYNSGYKHAGVILLRLEIMSGQEKVKVVSEILKNYSDKLYGNFCVYKNGYLRIKYE